MSDTPCPNCAPPAPPHPLDPLRPYLPHTLTLLTTLTLTYLYTRNRRIPTAAHLPPSYLQTRTLHGRITSINDPDNIHLFHTPLRFLHNIPSTRPALRNRTIHVRLAGIDAPELPHFGAAEQPGARQALQWIREGALGRRARVRVYSKDQYGRVVGRVEVRRWGGWGRWGVGLGWRDLGGEMVREGWATVYDAKSGAEFGGREERYRRAEAEAKSGGRGIWGLEGKVVRPGAFKAAEKVRLGVGPGKGKGGVVVVKKKVEEEPEGNTGWGSLLFGKALGKQEKVPGKKAVARKAPVVKKKRVPKGKE